MVCSGLMSGHRVSGGGGSVPQVSRPVGWWDPVH